MVSVIIPIYNSYKFIGPSIEMLRSQSFGDFEALYIENGSNDARNKKAIESLKDNRFKYFHINKKGVSNARNYGLSVANGQFICFLDVDDQIAHNYIECLYTSITSSNSDIALCDYYEVRGTKRKEVRLPEASGNIYSHSFIKEKLLPAFTNPDIFDSGLTMGVVWRSIFRKDFLDKNKLVFDNNLTIAEDLIFCIDSYGKAQSISTINIPLYNYIVHKGSSLRSARGKNYIKEGRYFNTIIRNKLSELGIGEKISKVNSFIFGTYTRASEYAAANNSFDEIRKICVWFSDDYKKNPFPEEELKSRERKLVFSLFLRGNVFTIFLLCKMRSLYI